VALAPESRLAFGGFVGGLWGVLATMCASINAFGGG
jgi:uncharacterized membrane protein YdjX (TVP38/TMEM64 family)